MSHFLTEATFRRGVSNYLKAFKYSAAEQDDLWEHLTAAAHQDNTLPQDVTVKTIMDTWTLQMGYPVIQVVRSPDGTSATVSQERFLLGKSENSIDSHEYKWWVPLTYTSQNEANFNNTKAMAWMKDSETNITITSLPTKDQWVIFDLQETGYYRVNYDDHNWNLLIQQLKTDHEVISTVNRAQIIDDAMNLVKAGHLSYETALGVYDYLGKEAEYLPWSVSVRSLNYLENMFRFTGGYGALKRYILDLVLPLYKSVGFTDKPEDPHLVQHKRRIAVSWACKLGHKDCLKKTLDLYRQWMANTDNKTIISANLQPTVYCNAIAEGGEAEWNFAWQQYLKSNVASEKSTLLSALGCSKEVWILSRYLDMAYTRGGSIRKQDTRRVFYAIAANDVGRDLAWDYLRLHWNDIYAYKKSRRGQVMKKVSYNFNTKQQLKEVERVMNDGARDLIGSVRGVQQAVEGVTNNVAWMKSNYDVIVKWLEMNGYSSKLREH